MEYNFTEIESLVQSSWKKKDIYKVSEDSDKAPFYVLDMFPYPSGAGLHVGHPLGYIASDIYSRYKRLNGFEVLHPMGYDAFGLPAEQYAIQTGQHPEITTNININRYREQLDKIGFSYDWSREIRTSSPDYYRWTQWVFSRLFESYYDKKTEKARPITELISHFEQFGTKDTFAYTNQEEEFTAEEWNSFSEREKSDFLMNYRLAYLGESVVNWCSELGTVLANDEVSEGLSVRGGYPVEQRKMKQWCLRISAYAERLLQGLDRLEWSDSLKEIQRNWIGKSKGAELKFKIDSNNESLTVFTTRPDTIYGVTFIVLAPESDIVSQITTLEQKEEVEEYIAKSKRKTERERIADKRVSGVFTGAYARHPLTQELLPIWISDYVLLGYGTGAIMAVPAHDTRDFAFAKCFNLPIKQVVVPLEEKESNPLEWEEAIASKEGHLVNSEEINGLAVQDAIEKMLALLDAKGIGKVKINYRLRDSIFSRQRYWGEPFPIYYKEGIPYLLSDDKLPLELPQVESFLPTDTGEPPLGRVANWVTEEAYPYELSTMPGFAGSSTYFLRYMDPQNKNALVGKKANEYWRNVNLYIGGTEHATGHLMYSRFWNKFLFDLGLICEDEPFQKLVNQGMIQGRSNFVYRIKNTNTFVTYSKKDDYETTEIHVDVNIVVNDFLDIDSFKKWRPEFKDADFILEEDGSYLCGYAVEKMSKSLYNVVNPDDIIGNYGADTLRLYEMFLGPLEQSKPWDTKGIDGVHRFLKKLLSLFYEGEQWRVTNDKPTKDELRSLHKLIKKVTGDIEAFSFNTSVAAFMICVGELQQLKTSSKEILEGLLIVLSPFAPHLTEYLYQKLYAEECSIVLADWPKYKEEFLQESTVKYPVSFNGKVRFTLELPVETSKEEVERIVLTAKESEKWLEGKQPKKVIVVLNRIVNIVL